MALRCGNFRTSTTANWPISALPVRTSRGSPGSTRKLELPDLTTSTPASCGRWLFIGPSGRGLHALGLDDRPRMRPGQKLDQRTCGVLCPILGRSADAGRIDRKILDLRG